MVSALVLALGLAPFSPSAPVVAGPLDADPSFRALDLGLKRKARATYGRLVEGLRPPPAAAAAPARPAAPAGVLPPPRVVPVTPAVPAPRADAPAVPAGKPPSRVEDLVARLRALGKPEADALPDEAYATVPAAAPAARGSGPSPAAEAGSAAAATPRARLVEGREARARPAGSKSWSELPPQGESVVGWHSLIATGKGTGLRLVLPDQAGIVSLSGETRVFVVPGLLDLERGEAKIETPAGARQPLRVRTRKGSLQIGPGGMARVRADSFQRLREPVTRSL